MPRHTAAQRASGAPWFTRARALLAGGLVLGVGAVMTYASWTDTEYASGSFGASVFAIESSVDGGTTWAEHPTAPGATLSFAAAGMSPTDVRFASIGVRTTQASVGGALTLAAPSATRVSADPNPGVFLADSLQYRVYRSATSACGSSSTPAVSADWIVGSASTYAALSAAGGQSTPLAAATAGTPTYFCFQVVLPAGAPNTLQGKSTDVTWQFQAVSS
jgi:predicted ribosomally synthesized peptide with SipW-like signal peptide